MKKASITWQTNFNHKLACDCFLHIDLPPASPLPESVVEDTSIEIKTADGSHEAVSVRMVDLCRLSLGQITSLASYASHGIDYYDFYLMFVNQHPRARLSTPVAIYYYKKIDS